MASREEEDWPDPLLANRPLLNPSEISLAKLLLKCGQSHLFAQWEPVGTADEKKHEFFSQLQSMHEAYPGGIEAYVQNARRLLAASAAGANPLEGWTPSVPLEGLGVQLTPGDAEFERYEKLGLEAAVHLAFAVPAGGLGERLGYSGVKFSLPAEISSGASVLQVYASHVLALQQLLTARLGREVRLPFLVMTSDDTHARIGALLQQHAHYGLAPSQVTLLKQQKVAALADAQARFAAAGPYAVQAKPHGHGDLHALLHASGIAARWQREGRRWLFLFQDSSTLYFSTYLASLGVAAERGLDLQYVTMPRRARMALGVLASLAPAPAAAPPAAPAGASASEMLRRLVVGGGVAGGQGGAAEAGAPSAGAPSGPARLPLIPIEYNQLEPMLAAAGGGSDANGPGGYSPFPGNTNGLIIGLNTYVAALERSGGAVPEFVNPKYSDGTRAAFSSPTRLECMMQDYAWLLPHGAKVGYVGYPLEFGYFPCKNGLATAARLAAQGVPPYAASTAEMAVYAAHAAALRLLGAKVAPARERTFHGVPVALGAAVVLAPSFCPCLSELRHKLPSPAQISISERSTLLVDGAHIRIEQLELDGALEVRVCAGASLTIRSLHVRNDGWQFDQLSDAVLKSASCPEVLRIRGYTLRKNGGRTIAVTQPGAWLVEEGVLSLDEEGGAAADGGGRRGSSVGGAILGDVPPPPNGTWSSSSLSLAPGSTMRVPLVLGAPSRVTLEVEPRGGGLHLSLLPEIGPPVLPPVYVPPAPSPPSHGSEGGGGEAGSLSGGGGSGGGSSGEAPMSPAAAVARRAAEIATASIAAASRASTAAFASASASACAAGQVHEVHVDGSGVFSVVLYNPSLFSAVDFRACVRHELEDAAVARERLSKEVAQQQQQRAARAQYAAELALLATQDTTLAASEADLSKRLWEVQEVRRRHAAMATQLRDAIAALGDE